MNMKRWVPILIGITIIAFGIGMFSLIYNDNFSTSNVFRNGIINVKSNGDNVKIDNNGIVVKDGNSNVKIGWNGIDVRDGDEHVTIGWGGITVTEGGETKFNLGNPNRWASNKWNNLNSSSINEEKYIEIQDIDSIIILSQFVDIKVYTEDRSDVRVKYYGQMKSNVIPKLDITRIKGDAVLKLDTPNNDYSVRESDVVLEVFVPIKYKKSIAATTSSADINIENLILEHLTLYTDSGDIKIFESEAESFDLVTSSGDIESKGGRGAFDIATSSGDVDLSVEESKGDIQITTSSGDVYMNYWIGTDYNVTGTSSSGDVYYNGPISLEKDSNGKFNILIGKGGNNLDITTSSGDIYLKNK
jgi:lia operon protein LiaG